MTTATWSLVAMSESGDTYVVRRPTGQLWLIVPDGGVGGGPIDDSAVTRAITMHGFRPVCEDGFGTLQLVDRRVNDLAIATEFQDSIATTFADVERFLPSLLDDAKDPSRATDVLDDVTDYLAVVADHPDLVRSLQVVLEVRARTIQPTLPKVTAGSVRWLEINQPEATAAVA